MDMGLQNRVALVTGASRGIGKEIALSLAREGVEVILCGRTEQTLQKAKPELEQYGVAAHIKVADLTKPSEVEGLFSEVVEKIGKLDIVVNAVGGVTKFGGFEDLSEEDWMESLRLNFMSMVSVSKNALPWLKKSDQARIINIASVPARQPGLYNPHYSVAKAAMLNLSKYLANNYAKDGIRVNAICPSTITGDNWDGRISDRAKREGVSLGEARKIMEDEEKIKVPLGVLGVPTDIASLVVYLSSSRAGFITGTCIDVDGGVVRSIL